MLCLSPCYLMPAIKGCKIEMRLNGWHGPSLSAVYIIESRVATHWTQMVINWYRLYVPAHSPLMDSFNPPFSCCRTKFLPPHSTWSGCPQPHFSHHFSPIILSCCYQVLYLWLWLVFSVAPGHVIRLIKSLQPWLLIVQRWGACQVL